MDSTKILMSVGTPSGAKLEELLADIKKDLEFKNSKLDTDNTVDRLIANNNTIIIQSLQNCIDVQMDTMDIVHESK